MAQLLTSRHHAGGLQPDRALLCLGHCGRLRPLGVMGQGFCFCSGGHFPQVLGVEVLIPHLSQQPILGDGVGVSSVLYHSLSYETSK